MKDLEHSLTYFNDRYRPLTHLVIENSEYFESTYPSTYSNETLTIEVNINTGVNRLQQGRIEVIPDLLSILTRAITLEELHNESIHSSHRERYDELFNFMKERYEEFKAGAANYNNVSSEAFQLQKAALKVGGSLGVKPYRMNATNGVHFQAYERLISQNFIEGYESSSLLADAKESYRLLYELSLDPARREYLTRATKTEISLMNLENKINDFEITVMLAGNG